MAYGEIYYHDYCGMVSGLNSRLSILKRDFVGEATLIGAGPTPFLKSSLTSDSDHLGGVYPTMARLYLLGDEEFDMDDLYTADDSEFIVEHYIDGVLDWAGFITPESFGETDTQDYRILSINAFDGLTRLKGLKFLNEAGQNYNVDTEEFTQPLLFAVKESLKKSGLELNILSLVDRTVMTTPSLSVSYTANLFQTGWVYSAGFTSVDPALIVVGNYLSYSYAGIDGVYTGLIEEVDTTDPQTVGVKVNPVPSAEDGLGQTIFAVFYAPNTDPTVDVLNYVDHNTLVWIDPEAEVSIVRKADIEKKYYEFTDGTWSCWDVLESIGLALDFRVFQSQGKWVLQAVDVNRLSEEYFQYSFDGVFIDRSAQKASVTIPECLDLIFYAADGNTKSVDKSYLSTSVQYQYRFKVKGDELVNVLPNGSFLSPPAGADPLTYTPDFWTRWNGGIPYSIYKPPVGAYLEFSTTASGFNSSSFLRSSNIVVSEEDELEIQWDQAVYQSTNLYEVQFYAAFMIRLIGEDGRKYYLVNSEDQPEWTNVLMTSPNPVGRWLESDKVPYFFLSNAGQTSINPDVSGFGDTVRVNVTAPAVPSGGNVSVAIVGEVQTGSGLSSSEELVSSYIHDFPLVDGKVPYIENTDTSLSTRVIWDMDGQVSRVQIGNMFVGRIPSGSEGEGHAYSYTQTGQFFDNAEPVVIPIGDEENIDHLSNLSVGGNSKLAWTTKDLSLQLGPLGLTLARAYMRRYLRPNKKIDGSWGVEPIDFGTVWNLENDPGRSWMFVSGDLDPKESTFSGTLYQLSDAVLPNGGEDLGPNSVSSSSDSSSSGAGGGGGAGSGSASSRQNLQEVTNQGAVTSAVLEVGGTINASVLTVPQALVASPDPALSYLHETGGALYVNGEKADAGNADTWEGSTQEDLFDQGVKSTDSVQFAAVTTDQLRVAVGPAPASATAPGVSGQVIFSAGAVYFCIAPNTWVRSLLSTW